MVKMTRACTLIYVWKYNKIYLFVSCWQQTQREFWACTALGGSVMLFNLFNWSLKTSSPKIVEKLRHKYASYLLSFCQENSVKEKLSVFKNILPSSVSSCSSTCRGSPWRSWNTSCSTPSVTIWLWRTLRTSSSTRKRAWRKTPGTVRQSLREVS